MKTLHVISEVASVKLLSEDGKNHVLIPNGFGDGITDVFIMEDDEYKPMPGVYRSCDIVGKWGICSTDYGTAVQEWLEGTYFVYFGEQKVFFQRISSLSDNK